MEVHKVTIVIVDLDEIGSQEVKEVIENAHYPNHCIYPDVMNIETVDIGEWDDDHPLNNPNTRDGELIRIFPSLANTGKQTEAQDA